MIETIHFVEMTEKDIHSENQFDRTLFWLFSPSRNHDTRSYIKLMISKSNQFSTWIFFSTISTKQTISTTYISPECILTNLKLKMTGPYNNWTGASTHRGILCCEKRYHAGVCLFTSTILLFHTPYKIVHKIQYEIFKILKSIIN